MYVLQLWTDFVKISKELFELQLIKKKKKNCLNYKNYVLLIINKYLLDSIVLMTITHLKLP